MKKKLSLLFILMCVGLSVFAYGGLMASESKIYIVSTKWFDIIYPEECGESALRLYEQADAIYEEMAEKYGKPIVNRLPVVITRETEVFNAYYASVPYNRIVLYDTVPTEDFSVMNDSLIDCFKHELNHAYTYTMTNKFWTGLAAGLGDFYGEIPSGWNVSSFMGEGASVFYESQGSRVNGRLNDSYFLQAVRQSKISGKFPHWSDVLGARSITPGAAACYAFGGPFTEYLVSKYGMEKYATLWYKCVNFQTAYFPIGFKKIYGVSLNAAWKDFINEIEVSEVAYENPLDEPGVKDFFKGNYYIGNGENSRYDSLSSYDNGFVYMDNASGKVYGYENNSIKTLFDGKYIYGVKASNDGKQIVYYSYDINGAAESVKVSIWNRKSGFTLNISEEGLRDACIVKNGDKTFLCAVKLDGASSCIKIYELKMKKDEAVGYDEIGSIAYERNVVPFSLNDDGNGRLALIVKNGLNWSVRVYENVFENCSEGLFEYSDYTVDAGEGFRFRNLDYAGTENGKIKFTLSYATRDSLPRYGEFVLDGENGVFRLMNENISGGILFPVALNGKVYYSADFYFRKDLYELDLTGYSFNELSCSVNNGKDYAFVLNEEVEHKVNDLISFSSEFKNVYAYKGTFIPCSMISPISFDKNAAGNLYLKNVGILPIGLTYLTIDPWNNTTVYLTSLEDWFNLTWGLGAGISGVQSNFNYSDSAYVIFDTEGFNQVSNSASVSSSYAFGRNGSATLSASNILFYGKNYFTPKKMDFWNNAISTITGGNVDSLPWNTVRFDGTVFIDRGDFEVKVSGIHKSGRGVNEYAGVAAGVNYNYKIDRVNGENIDDSWYFNSQVSPFMTVALPKLLPLADTNNFTFNLPTVLSASMYADGDCVLKGRADMTLFSWEIQKGLGYVPLFLNSLSVTAAYDFGFYDNNDNINCRILNIAKDSSNLGSLYYDDVVSVRVDLNASINSGMAARMSNALTGFFEIDYSITNSNKTQYSNNPWNFAGGVKVNLLNMFKL